MLLTGVRSRQHTSVVTGGPDPCSAQGGNGEYKHDLQGFTSATTETH